MTTLSLAVKATIPIINVRSEDMVNIETLLTHSLGKPAMKWPLASSFDPASVALSKAKLNVSKVFYSTDPEFKCTESLYNWLVEHEKVLILVNHVGTPFGFYCGDLVPTTKLISKILDGHLQKDTIDDILPYLKGLTIKSIIELIRLTGAKEGTITSRGVKAHRHLVSKPINGLEVVDTDLKIYLPCADLTTYLNLNEEYYSSTVNPLLVPRGLLLSGEPGTGKSLAAKYIANRFGVPLFRIDLSSSLSKYVGDSEQQVKKILEAVIREGSAVLLIDEVEKLFGESDDSGVTYRILAQLLWFLQEHKELIFTVMTCNDISKIPPELYRRGRVDDVIVLQPFNMSQARTLIIELLKQFDSSLNPIASNCSKWVDAISELLIKLGNKPTPALITAETYKYVKKHKLFQ